MGQVKLGSWGLQVPKVIKAIKVIEGGPASKG